MIKNMKKYILFKNKMASLGWTWILPIHLTPDSTPFRYPVSVDVPPTAAPFRA